MSEWQPIETAPKGQRITQSGEPRHQMVIVFAGGHRFAYQSEHGQWYGVLNRPLTVKPTHWMPLPEPPS